VNSNHNSSSNWPHLRGAVTRYLVHSSDTSNFPVPDTLPASTDVKTATEAILKRIQQKRAMASNASTTNETKIKLDEDKLTQLSAMGFSRHASTRALLLHRNSVESSIVWLLENSSLPNINEPLTNEEYKTLSYSNPLLSFHRSHSPSASSHSNGSTSRTTSTTRALRNGTTGASPNGNEMGRNSLIDFNFFEIPPTTMPNLPLSLERIVDGSTDADL